MKKLSFEQMENVEGGLGQDCQGFTTAEMWTEVWFLLTPGLFTNVNATFTNIGNNCWFGESGWMN